MSSKKDNFNKNNSKYIKIAINLAKQNAGLTGMNPSVGTIIVKNCEIISYGLTELGGRPHSEYVAIKNCKSKLKNSSIYISLEPCSHYGKTPPCTNSIIRSGIKKVYYAVDDIDERSSKKAMIILNKKKIKVTKNLLRNEAKKIYNTYFYSKKNKIPYIIGKIACSSDKLISSQKKYITNKHSLNVSHLLRYRCNGLLVSYKTINSDNPKLTCRIKGLEKYSPTRFIIDKDGKIKTNSYVVNTARKYKTYILYNRIAERKKENLLRKGVKLIYMDLNENKRFNFNSMFKIIYKLNILTLMIEGGKSLTESLVKLNLYNEFYLFISEIELGRNGKMNISNIIKKMSKNFKYKKNINTYLDKDKLINYY